MIHARINREADWRRAVLALSLVVFVSGSPAAQDKSGEAKPNPYCVNIADAAADARFALQKEALANMEKEIESRIRILEAKRAEYEEWLDRRNEVLKKADETVVSIYSRMRPDAAALQLSNMEDEIAAAILARLNPRAASAVMNEMEPARAAELTNIITDAPKRSKDTARQG